MSTVEESDRIAIDVRSHRLLRTLLRENPKLESIMRNAKNPAEARVGIQHWVFEELSGRGQVLAWICHPCGTVQPQCPAPLCGANGWDQIAPLGEGELRAAQPFDVAHDRPQPKQSCSIEGEHEDEGRNIELGTSKLSTTRRTTVGSWWEPREGLE